MLFATSARIKQAICGLAVTGSEPVQRAGRDIDRAIA